MSVRVKLHFISVRSKVNFTVPLSFSVKTVFPPWLLLNAMTKRLYYRSWEHISQFEYWIGSNLVADINLLIGINSGVHAMFNI